MMNIFGRGVRKYAVGLGVLASCALGASAEESGPYDSPVKNETSAAIQTPEAVIRNWPERPRGAARALIAKYGEPSRFDDNDLVWLKNGPWSKTVVYRKAPQGRLHDKDILVQSIAYDVPEKKVAELRRFDSRIKFDKASGELSSSAENESLNYLALNLADEIVADKRSPDEARDLYRKTVTLTESGKSSAYADGFVFAVSTEKTSTQAPSEKPSPAEAPYQSGMPDRVEPSNGSTTGPGLSGDVVTPPNP